MFRLQQRAHSFIATCLLLGLTACDPTATAPAETPTPPPVKAVTITFSGGDPESLNPLYAATWTAECVFDLLYLPLWNVADGGRYHMELAEALPTLENGGVSPDGLTINIKLRKDALWSDGTPVTADDAVFTYNMIIADKNSVFSRYPFDTYVESMRAVDANTFEIKLSQPYLDWSTSIFTRYSRVLPKHILEPVFLKDGTLDNAAWNRMPQVVDGPFRVTEFESGSHLSFAANDQYWRGRPKLDKIFFRFVVDRAAEVAALDSGQSDIGSYNVSSAAAKAVMEKMERHISENGQQLTLFMNIDPATAHPAISDPNVRRAIALATDRQLLIDKVYNGLYQIPVTFWHGTAYNNPALKPYAFNPELAKQLLDEAGWKAGADGVRAKDGQPLVLRYAYIPFDATDDTMVVSIQQMLGEVGIKVDLFSNTQETLWASYADNGLLARGQYDLTHWSDGMWYYPAPDTSYFLCSERPTDDYPRGYNWFGICSPELD